MVRWYAWHRKMEGVSYKLPWLIGDMSQLILMDTPASEFGVGAIRTARDWAGTLFPWRVHCSPLLRNENCLVHLVHGSKLWWLKTPEIQRNLKGEILGLKWSEASPLNCQLTPVPEANNTMASWAGCVGSSSELQRRSSYVRESQTCRWPVLPKGI